jgi:hypothetical protein
VQIQHRSIVTGNPLPSEAEFAACWMHRSIRPEVAPCLGENGFNYGMEKFLIDKALQQDETLSYRVEAGRPRSHHEN